LYRESVPAFGEVFKWRRAVPCLAGGALTAELPRPPGRQSEYAAYKIYLFLMNGFRQEWALSSARENKTLSLFSLVQQPFLLLLRLGLMPHGCVIYVQSGQSGKK
jgi:hypothetical protein